MNLTLQPQHPTLHFAGQELMRYLQQLPVCTGDLEVRLSVDPSPSENDRYCYGFAESSGFVTGSNPRSVLLGVYAYLRDLGFVFLLPGDDGTFVPAITDRQQLCRRETCHSASHLHRGVCVEGADALENVLAFIDWLPKNGYNSFFVQFKKPDVFFERWYDHVFNPLLKPEPKTRQELDQMEQAVTQAMALRGILDHRVGHGWTAEALGFSNTGWHTENGQLPEDIRPLVAEVNGQRQLWGGVPTNTNLCYANPEAQRRLIDQVVAYAKAHPNTDYLHFWLADENNNLCECPQCRSTTLSDQYVQILNQLDAQLTREGLNTKIVFLLYQELLYAPLHSRLANRSRFCLMFAPISRTFERSYPLDRAEQPIAPYVRNHWQLPQTVEENLSHYFQWKRQFSGESFFYDYPLGRAHYGDFGYMKIARVIYDDIHALKALGTDGYMSCQELRAATPTGFPNFVMGQALLDTALSYEDLKKTYFEAMFGQNYPAVVAYLEQLSELSDTDYFNGHGPRIQPDKATRFCQIAQTAAAFALDLESLRSPQPQAQRHWEFLHFHARYTIALARALEALALGQTEEANRRFEAFCDAICRQELQWQSRLDVYRVIEVAGKYTGFTRGSAYVQK